MAHETQKKYGNEIKNQLKNAYGYERATSNTILMIEDMAQHNTHGNNCGIN